jgi:hypothetical protein
VLCRTLDDVGSLHLNRSGRVWYECVFDARRDLITWAILPPTDE